MRGEGYTGFWWEKLKDFWIRETGTGQQVAQLHDRYDDDDDDDLKERDYLGDPDVDGRIILRWIFRK